MTKQTNTPLENNTKLQNIVDILASLKTFNKALTNQNDANTDLLVFLLEKNRKK